MTSDKKISIYLMIVQNLDLKPFINQLKNKTEGVGLIILTPKQML